jgi:hypothetical protein
VDYWFRFVTFRNRINWVCVYSQITKLSLRMSTIISHPIQVALSGSGFLLPVHVGALQAIHSAGYQVTALS